MDNSIKDFEDLTNFRREEDRMCDFRRNYGSVGATARLEQRWVRVCGRRENDCLTPCHESFSIFLERTCTVASGCDHEF
ncbi:hypothetical protein YC2023_070643 [Brassica napus]